MPDYTVRTNFDKTAALSSVIFGADGLILETEINELQDILSDRIRDLIKDKFGDGFYKKDTSVLNYSGGALSLSNDKAFADGYIVNITDLSLALAEGETAYLDVWAQEVTHTSTLKIYGNQQETTTVTNNILDPRPEITEETSRRFQIQYNMVKTTGAAGHTYLPIATITAGVAVDKRAKTEDVNSASVEFKKSDGTLIGKAGFDSDASSILRLYNSVLNGDINIETQGTGVVKINNNEVLDVTNALSKTNTTPYTPSEDYHPATKKFVEDNSVSNQNYTTFKSYTNKELANIEAQLEIDNKAIQNNGKIYDLFYGDNVYSAGIMDGSKSKFTYAISAGESVFSYPFSEGSFKAGQEVTIQDLNNDEDVVIEGFDYSIDRKLTVIEGLTALYSTALPTTASSGPGQKMVKDGSDLYLCFYENNPGQIKVLKTTDYSAYEDLLIPGIQSYAQLNPSMVIDSQKNIHVVWQGMDATHLSNHNIKYCKWDGVSWSDIVSITSYNDDSIYPVIACDSNDKLHVIFRKNDLTLVRNALMYINSADGGITWSTEQSIAASSTYHNYEGDMKIDSGDNIHVAWTGQAAGYTGTTLKYSKSVDSGASWGAEALLPSDTSTAYFFARIVIDKNNEYHILAMAPNQAMYFGEVYHTSGQSLYGGTNITAGDGAISINDFGHIYVYYRNSGSGYYRVSYNQGDTWGTQLSAGQCHYSVASISYNLTNEPLTMYYNNQRIYIKGVIQILKLKSPLVNSYDAGAIMYRSNLDNGIMPGLIADKILSGFPSSNVDLGRDAVVIDSNNNIYIAYSDQALGYYQVRVFKSSDNGATWTDLEFPYNGGSTYPDHTPSLAIDDLDAIHIVWSSKHPGYLNYNIRYAKFDGTLWSGLYDISDVNSSSWEQTGAIIAVKGDYIAVAWKGNSVASNGVSINVRCSVNGGSNWYTWRVAYNGSDPYPLDPQKIVYTDTNNYVYIFFRLNPSSGNSYVMSVMTSVTGQSFTNYQVSIDSDGPDVNNRIYAGTHSDMLHVIYIQTAGVTGVHNIYLRNTSPQASWLTQERIQVTNNVSSNIDYEDVYMHIDSQRIMHIIYLEDLSDSGNLTRNIKYVQYDISNAVFSETTQLGSYGPLHELIMASCIKDNGMKAIFYEWMTSPDYVYTIGTLLEVPVKKTTVRYNIDSPIGTLTSAAFWVSREKSENTGDFVVDGSLSIVDELNDESYLPMVKTTYNVSTSEEEDQFIADVYPENEKCTLKLKITRISAIINKRLTKILGAIE